MYSYGVPPIPRTDGGVCTRSRSGRFTDPARFCCITTPLASGAATHLVKRMYPTLFSRSRCTPRVRVGVTSSKGPLIYPSSATFCAHFGPCVGDLHPPHFARIFEPDHRPPLFRRKCKPMRAPGEAAANSPTGGGVRAVRCDSHVSDAMGEMTSCGRRSVGPGR